MATEKTAQRVLIVEDEFLIALHVEDVMTGLGFEVVGPIPTLEQALDIARSEPLDGAVLDVNLAGTYVFPLAEELALRGVPFIMTTGYEAFSVPESLRDRPRLQKPVREAELIRLARSIFGGQAVA